MIKFIQKNMNKKGFTLVELIIVIAVMAILAAIVVPRMTGITESFRVKADERYAEMLAREVQVQVQLGNISLPANATFANPTATELALLGTIETPAETDMDEYQIFVNNTTVRIQSWNTSADPDAESTRFEEVNVVHGGVLEN